MAEKPRPCEGDTALGISGVGLWDWLLGSSTFFRKPLQRMLKLLMSMAKAVSFRFSGRVSPMLPQVLATQVDWCLLWAQAIG